MLACELCGVVFEPSKPSQRFCTSACRKRAHRQRQREPSSGVVAELPNGSRFENNTARIDGGGIWNLFGVHLQGTTFSNNIPNDCANAPSSPPTAAC